MEKPKRSRGRPRKYGSALEAFSIRLPESVFLELSHFAVDARASLNEVVNVAVSEYLKAAPPPSEFERPDLGASGLTARKPR